MSFSVSFNSFSPLHLRSFRSHFLLLPLSRLSVFTLSSHSCCCSLMFVSRVTTFPSYTPPMFPSPVVPFASARSPATFITSRCLLLSHFHPSLCFFLITNTLLLVPSPLSCLPHSFCCHSHIHLSPCPLEPSITISRKVAGRSLGR